MSPPLAPEYICFLRQISVWAGLSSGKYQHLTLHNYFKDLKGTLQFNTDMRPELAFNYVKLMQLLMHIALLLKIHMLTYTFPRSDTD